MYKKNTFWHYQDIFFVLWCTDFKSVTCSSLCLELKLLLLFYYTYSHKQTSRDSHENTHPSVPCAVHLYRTGRCLNALFCQSFLAAVLMDYTTNWICFLVSYLPPHIFLSACPQIPPACICSKQMSLNYYKYNPRQEKG